MSEKKKPPGRRKITIDYDLLEKLCTIQCSDAEIAAVLGISIDTITRRKQNDEQFADIYTKGREGGKMRLRRKMYETAMSGHVAMGIFLSKQYLGMADKQEIGGKDGGDMKLQFTLVESKNDKGSVEN